MEKKFLGSTGLANFLEHLYNVFSQVGHTHTKSQITDFPTIPTKVSQLTNDSGFVSTDTNTTYTLSKSGSTITLTGTDGSSQTVEDSDTTITVDSELSGSSTNPVQNKTIKSEFDGIQSQINQISDEKVGVIAQDFTDEQKTQARTNIGALGDDDLEQFAMNDASLLPGSLKWDGVIGDREHLVLTGDETVRYVYVHLTDEIPPNLTVDTVCVSGSVIIEESPVYIAEKGLYKPEEDGSVGTFGESGYMIAIHALSILAPFPKTGIWAIAVQYALNGDWVSVQYGSTLYIPGYTFAASNSDLPSDFFVEERTPIGGGSDILTWDGDTTGLVCVAVEENASVCKISDSVPAITDFANGCIISVNSDGVVEEIGLGADEVYDFGDGFIVTNGYFYVIPYDNFTLDEVSFRESGIYATYTNDGTVFLTSLTIPGYKFCEYRTEPKLNVNYLPASHQFGEVEIKSDTLTWDGNTEGLANIPLDSADGTVIRLYRVSSAVPTLEDFMNGTTAKLYVSISDDTMDVEVTVQRQSESGDLPVLAGTVNLTGEFTVFYVIETFYAGFAPGIYLYNEDNSSGNSHVSSLTINGYTGFITKEFRTIDPMYLPEGVGGSGLPEVSAEDNGKSLNVVDGEWVIRQQSYNDLTDKPELFSKSYNDLTDKPELFSKSYNDLTDKPELFSKSYNDLTDKPELFSKSYNDLTDKPIPDAATSTNGAFLRVVNGAWTAVVLPNAEEATF